MKSYSRAVEFIDNWFSTQHANTSVPGLVLAIARKGKPIFCKAYGLANLETKQPMRTDQLFPIASQSKMFTACGILLLKQWGMLDLDDRITKHLPRLKKHPDSKMAGITIRQLLHHRAGVMRDGKSTDYWQLQTDFPTNQELWQEVMRSPLVTANYSKLKYSNVGYFLLGQVIEALSGQSYTDFSWQHIIKPLGLTNIYPDFAPEFISRTTMGYTRPFSNGRRLAVPRNIKTGALGPMCGWYATAEAMCKFATAHLKQEENWLNTQNRTLMLETSSQHLLLQDQGSKYGIGHIWFNFGGRPVVGHGGAFIGHRTCTYTDINTELTVVIMANAKETPVVQMVRNIFSVFDYFKTRTTQPTPPEWERFNCSLSDIWGDAEIVATGAGIQAIYPDKWLPFANVEELSYVNDHTLKIAKTHDFAPIGEDLDFVFKNGQLDYVNYAGITARPRHLFESWIKNSWPSAD